MKESLIACRRQIALVADELNQFAMTFESLAASLRVDPQVSAAVNADARRAFDAARRMRERIAEVIADDGE